MNFCAKCGRQRTGGSRFCGGCGNDFGEQAPGSGAPMAADPVAKAPVEPLRWDAPAEQSWDATRWDPPADATRMEPAIALPPAQAPPGPNPFAPWPAEPSPAGGAGFAYGAPADRWETADTISAKPGQGPGSPPPPPPPVIAFPPSSAPVDSRRGSGGGRRAAFIIVLLLVVLAAGGGAYALVSRSGGSATAGPPSNPTATATASTGASAVEESASASQASSSAASASASPSASPSPSPSPSPTHTGTVQVGAGVAGDPAEPEVESFLNRYFKSINTRNYAEYNSLLDPQLQQADSQAAFDAGFATTRDSNEVLTGITDTGGGDVTAEVSFTSHQSPADSVDKRSSCNDWQLSLYLVPQGGGLVETAAPAGYTASYTDC
jgi:hypothetical protein